MPKYVASTTLNELEWETASPLEGPVTDVVAAVKEQDGGPILVPGSRTLFHTLLEAGLVDERNLQVFPVLLGSGMRLFPETTDKTALELVASRAVASGVVVQTYKPAAA